MARSNNTLSGCLEPTLASGLLTFLFVQATLTAIRPARKIIGIRRDIAPRKYRELGRVFDPAMPPRFMWRWSLGLRPAQAGQRPAPPQTTALHSFQRGLHCRLQKLLGGTFWIAPAAHRVSPPQNFRPPPPPLRHHVEGSTPG